MLLCEIRVPLKLLLTLASISAFSVQLTGQTTRNEVLTCGIRERWGFAAFRDGAGNTTLNEEGAAEHGIYKVTFPTSDGRTLGGAHLRSTSQPRGAILVIQGNAHNATRLVPELLFLRDAGFDVFIYDFRGYAMSRPGVPRFRAIVQDYRELFEHIRSRGYSKVHIYGFSFGGVIATNALARSSGWASFVIDSSPSRLTQYGCPRATNPMENLPADSRNVLMITGGRDRLVRTRAMTDMIAVARARGATVWSEPEWGHPFQRIPDSPNDARRRRLVEFFRSR